MGWRITPTYQTRQAAPKVRQNRFKHRKTACIPKISDLSAARHEYWHPTAITKVQTMANLEHLKILGQGIDAWNKW
jgi:hypothetical protein